MIEFMWLEHRDRWRGQVVMWWTEKESRYEQIWAANIITQRRGYVCVTIKINLMGPQHLVRVWILYKRLPVSIAAKNFYTTCCWNQNPFYWTFQSSIPVGTMRDIPCDLVSSDYTGASRTLEGWNEQPLLIEVGSSACQDSYSSFYI